MRWQRSVWIRGTPYSAHEKVHFFFRSIILEACLIVRSHWHLRMFVWSICAFKGNICPQNMLGTVQPHSHWAIPFFKGKPPGRKLVLRVGFPCASVSKRVYLWNRSYENDFDLHENETAGRTHFHLKGFEHRLVLKQRHKRTRKWPITFCILLVSGINSLQYKIASHSRKIETSKII